MVDKRAGEVKRQGMPREYGRVCMYLGDCEFGGGKIMKGFEGEEQDLKDNVGVDQMLCGEWRGIWRCSGQERSERVAGICGGKPWRGLGQLH